MNSDNETLLLKISCGYEFKEILRLGTTAVAQSYFGIILQFGVSMFKLYFFSCWSKHKVQYLLI